jgi:hypothetical protein
MKNKLSRLVTAIPFIMGAHLAQAHHSGFPHFDSTKPVVIEGVVKNFKFVNPHAYIYVDVTDENGEVVTWNCEMNAATGLRRAGWTEELFSPGTEIVIEGASARRDPHGCSYNKGTLSDGTEIARGGEITKSGKSLAVAEAADTPKITQDLSSIAGVWATTPRNRGGGGPGRSGDANPFEKLMTDAGKKAADIYDDRFDDPALFCSPSSIVRGWGEPNSTSEIIQTADKITIKHTYMDTVRTVDMTTRQHPSTITPSLTGHSVGWFEGETLVIETVGFAAGVLLPHPGVLHTDQMKVVERLNLSDDGMTLIRDYEVQDPVYLKTPLTGSSSWSRSDIPVSKYDCTELSGVNNVRPE